MREVDGFALVPMAVQEEPGSRYYRAAVHVSNEATGFDRVQPVPGQLEGFGGSSEEEALSAAEAYLKTIIAVNEQGQLWDRPAE